MNQESRSRLSHEVVMLAIAVALGLLGWGFNAWSGAVETGTTSMIDKMDDIVNRVDRADRRFELLMDRVSALEKSQAVLEQRMKVVEDHHRKEDGHVPR